jgi:hypothetical protein
MMDKIHLCNLNVVMLGDFNLNLLEPQPHWDTIVNVTGLSQLIQNPTRVTQSSCTLLDHIYTNNKKIIKKAFVSDICLSDHKPIICKWSCKLPKSDPKKHSHIMYRKFKTFSKEEFLSDLSQVNFNDITNIPDPEEATDLLIQKLLSVVDKHAPLRMKRVKHSSIPSWMTQDIKDAMALRDKLKKNKQFEDYKKQRNTVTDLVRKAKKLYFQNLLSDPTSNQISQVWKAMNEFTNKSRNTQPSSNHPFSATEFNTQFLTTADTLVNSISSEKKYVIPNKLKQFCDGKLQSTDSFNIPYLTVFEVGKFVSQLSNKKSMDIHNLNSSIIKLSLPYIIEPLTYIYNLCIQLNKFPSSFKMAKVIPIPKCKESSSIDNFRPISILSILSKPLERHIHKHLTSFVENKGLIHSYQSGFRPKHSCHTALTRICDSWLGAINQRNLVGTVFLDLRKAFDLVNHDILTQKLQIYLQSENSTSLLSSYLSGRQQCVYTNGLLSLPGPVKFGVPQGSVLGPLLFSLYINDMPLTLSHRDATLDLFADDSQLHTQSRSLDQIQNTLQTSITEIHHWCDDNQMLIHPRKSKSMLITTRQKHQRGHLQLKLNLKGLPIEQVEEHKVLGVIIDNNLSWQSHIDFVAKRLSKNLFLMSKLRLIVSQDAIKKFFYAHCLSHLNYASTVWCNASDANIKQLNSLHKRAIKILCTTPQLSTQEKYNTLNILTLHKQFQYNASVLMYKVFTEDAPKYLTDLFTKSKKCQRLPNFKLPLPRIDLYKSSFAFWGASIWNSLPLGSRLTCTLSSFKSSIYKYFLKSKR